MSTRAFALVVVIGVMTSIPSEGQAPASVGQPPPTPPGAALVIGRVIDGTTGAAVVGVTVTISGPSAPRTGTTVLVDSRGQFIFSGLPAGVFTLLAQKNGYLSGSYGRALPGGQSQSIELQNDERRTDATIRVWRYGSMSGRVVDEVGEPVSGVYVSAFLRTWVAGRASLTAFGGNRPTDDRGMYRNGRLAPGEYVVGVTSRLTTYPIGFVEADAATRQAGGASEQARSAELAAKGTSMLGMHPAFASPRIGDFTVASEGADTPLPRGNERLSIFPITFYPDAPTTDLASPILLAAGEQRSGVDLHLRLTPTVKVSGTATGPDGPIENLGLRMQLGPESQFWSRMLVEPAHTVSAANGAFTFLGVPPGSFTIVAAVSTMPGEAISAVLPITVGDKDLVDVSLTLHRNSRASGRVEFDGTSNRPSLQWLSQLLRFDPADGRFEPPTFQIDSDGAFVATVPTGRYFVRLNAGAAPAQLGAWTLKSAMVGGRDVSDVPMTVDGSDITGLVVTLTDKATRLTGTVRDSRGAADVATTILLFPTDRALWTDYGAVPRRLRTARPDRNGTFSIAGLPAGEYYAIAISEERTIDWQRQPFLLQAMGRATRVKIDDGRNTAVNLVTSRWQ